ncbi:DUF2992 family protein [Candidatus Protochlamydia amoebophila]|uniref:Uncharacterized protein n=1 Tax=Protochlamydia amoebophila (strain UWE25) TaxID=264201 RepID=Q6MDY4_PARUW|nr:DUF2992 family protein [Candidatus Protochlamydia amoebophila]CAF23215.1 unnamed protein product [Candidatus Protochlamydia amoebophila UWE25]
MKREICYYRKPYNEDELRWLQYVELKFREAKEVSIQIQRLNPKRVQREVHREMEKIEETPKPSNLAQDYMREEIEKKKKRKKKHKRRKAGS